LIIKQFSALIGDLWKYPPFGWSVFGYSPHEIQIMNGQRFTLSALTSSPFLQPREANGPHS
jgi:hypothetical protein